MKIAPTLLFISILLSVNGWTADEGPNRPEPKAVTLDRKSTALLVLDLNARCDDPKQVCSKITAPLGDFLDKARAASVPIIYTVSTAAKGKPIGELAAPLRRKENEVIIYPDGFDKFYSGELQPLLKDKGIQTLIITGSSTNSAVLYTATTAARMHRYTVVIPMDGVNAATRYEHEYAIHQFSFAFRSEQIVPVHESVNDQLSLTPPVQAVQTVKRSSALTWWVCSVRISLSTR